MRQRAGRVACLIKFSQRHWFFHFNAWEDTAFPPTKKEREERKIQACGLNPICLTSSDSKAVQTTTYFLSSPFSLAPGFPPQIGMIFLSLSVFFFFLFLFPSSVFPGSSDPRAVISHPAIESTQRMAHDQSLSALIYSSRKTHSASSGGALENSRVQFSYSYFLRVFSRLSLVSFSEQQATA